MINLFQTGYRVRTLAEKFSDYCPINLRIRRSYLVAVIPRVSLNSSLLLTCLTLSLPTGLLAQDRLQVDLLARAKGCYECHGAKSNSIGPSFRNIAMRYANDESGRASLISIVKDGGKGNWTEVTGGVPMPPYSGRLSDEEVMGLIEWIMSHQ